MAQQEHLQEVYGPLASFSEHHPGDRIRYPHEGAETAGQIIWVCAPAPDRGLHICYVVVNDIRGGMPDTVFPSDVLAAE